MRFLIAIALLPALVLMYYVYKKDGVEKEPVGLVMKVFAFGALGAIVAGFVESFVIDALTRTLSGWALLVAEYFIGVAAVEEAVKYLALNTVRKNSEFNYVFDGVVYGVAAALGFAALENVLYVFDGGVSVAVMRAIFSVPGHAADGVIMGCFFGIARRHQVQGRGSRAAFFYFLAYLMPVLEHGFYDMALSADSDALALVALVFDLVFIAIAFLVVRHMSAHDEPIYLRSQSPFEFSASYGASPQPPSTYDSQMPTSLPPNSQPPVYGQPIDGEVVQNPYYQPAPISSQSSEEEG